MSKPLLVELPRIFPRRVFEQSLWEGFIEFQTAPWNNSRPSFRKGYDVRSVRVSKSAIDSHFRSPAIYYLQHRNASIGCELVIPISFNKLECIGVVIPVPHQADQMIEAVVHPNLYLLAFGS